VRNYIAKRQADTILVRRERITRTRKGVVNQPEIRRPVSNAEINRELAHLKRAFTLAVQAGKLLRRPHIPMLDEQNARSGFFEREQLDAVVRHLPDALRPVVRFGYITGWRIPSEVLPLQWRHVNFDEKLSPNQAVPGTVRLDAGTTKNGDGRVFPMTTDLRTLLLDQKREADRLKREHHRMPLWVFTRSDKRGIGRPIKSFIKAFRVACRHAGCPGRIPHDFRRTAVRSFVRAGIPERVAMEMTGHKTRSVFERYNIVSNGDLADAAARLDRASGTIVGQSGVFPADSVIEPNSLTRQISAS
jgi:integrase